MGVCVRVFFVLFFVLFLFLFCFFPVRQLILWIWVDFTFQKIYMFIFIITQNKFEQVSTIVIKLEKVKWFLSKAKAYS